jgi:hypothetical protein
LAEPGLSDPAGVVTGFAILDFFGSDWGSGFFVPLVGVDVLEDVGALLFAIVSLENQKINKSNMKTQSTVEPSKMSKNSDDGNRNL